MKESQGKTVYLRDYRPPAYLIDETHLTVQLFEDRTLVHSRLLMRRNPDAPAGGGRELVLDGANMELLRIAVDDRELGEDDYTIAGESLNDLAGCDIPGIDEQIGIRRLLVCLGDPEHALCAESFAPSFQDPCRMRRSDRDRRQVRTARQQLVEIRSGCLSQNCIDESPTTRSETFCELDALVDRGVIGNAHPVQLIDANAEQSQERWIDSGDLASRKAADQMVDRQSPSHHSLNDRPHEGIVPVATSDRSPAGAFFDRFENVVDAFAGVHNNDVPGSSRRPLT